jgi:outer membrane lipoprotein carrier protein
MMTHGFPSFRPWIVAIALAGAVASGSPLASAQQPQPTQQPSAETVASWVQTFYDQTRTMSARFTQRYHNRVYDRTDTSRGRVRFRKPGMMRFDYDQPNGKIIVTTGDRLLVYEPPSDGSGPGQYYEQAMSEAQLPDALSFLTGTGRLADDFTFRLLDARRLGFTQGQVLELRSRRPTPHYSRILLFVDASPQRRGVVHRVLIEDQAHNTNTFDFQQQQLNRDVPEADFRWRPPRGAHRIQP